jgi:hypothetical protein
MRNNFFSGGGNYVERKRRHYPEILPLGSV